MQPVTHRCVTSGHVLRVIMTTIMSWQRHPVPVSSTASVGWGSGCRRGTGRSLSWSTMTSSTSRRRGRRSGWRRGRSFFFSRELTTTGGRYVHVQNIYMAKNSLIEENTHVTKSGLLCHDAHYLNVQRRFSMRRHWLVPQLASALFSPIWSRQRGTIKLKFSLSLTE